MQMTTNLGVCAEPLDSKMHATAGLTKLGQGVILVADSFHAWSNSWTAAALQLENRTLKIAAYGNLLLAIVGCTAAALSGSQAILLDGLFNLTYFATGLFTIRVARLVAGGDDERFPHGYAFFEPLVNGIKGMLVLGVSVLAGVGSVQALLTGGRPIAAGTAVLYGLLATSGCIALAWITRRGAKATGSPLCRPMPRTGWSTPPSPGQCYWPSAVSSC